MIWSYPVAFASLVHSITFPFSLILIHRILAEEQKCPIKKNALECMENMWIILLNLKVLQIQLHLKYYLYSFERKQPIMLQQIKLVLKSLRTQWACFDIFCNLQNSYIVKFFEVFFMIQSWSNTKNFCVHIAVCWWRWRLLKNNCYLLFIFMQCISKVCSKYEIICCLSEIHLKFLCMSFLGCINHMSRCKKIDIQEMRDSLLPNCFGKNGQTKIGTSDSKPFIPKLYWYRLTTVVHGFHQSIRVDYECSNFCFWWMLLHPQITHYSLKHFNHDDVLIHACTNQTLLMINTQ